MKIFINTLTACVLCILLAACSKDVAEKNADANGVAELKFNILNYRQTNLDDVETDEVTRATSVDVLAHLAYAAFDEEGKCVEKVLQDKGSAGYGSVSMSLPYGRYTLVFLGYGGSAEVQLISPTSVSFADDYVPNCFCKTMTLDVNEQTQAQNGVTLSRCVGCFSVVCNKGVPSLNMTMQIEAQGGGTVLNATTGCAVATRTRQCSIRDNGTTLSKERTFNVYMFLPTEEAKMNFTVTAVDSEGREVSTRTFADVPMRINRRVTYEGDFFAEWAGSCAFNLVLENDVWEEERVSF